MTAETDTVKPMVTVVVEDDHVCREFIGATLGGMCSSVRTIESLRELWPILVTGDIDLIWLDLALVDSSAENTLNSLPAIRNILPSATLIVVSGWGDEYEKRALQLGADAYSGKVELQGFRPPAVAKLLTAAAMAALKRGAPANIILERAAKLVGTVADARHTIPSTPP